MRAEVNEFVDVVDSPASASSSSWKAFWQAFCTFACIFCWMLKLLSVLTRKPCRLGSKVCWKDYSYVPGRYCCFRRLRYFSISVIRLPFSLLIALSRSRMEVCFTISLEMSSTFLLNSLSSADFLLYRASMLATQSCPDLSFLTTSSLHYWHVSKTHSHVFSCSRASSRGPL